ncbi:hypothetical protein BDN71DRAFT_465055 [Pleurotus eryngii]|uniref:Uncharacterized protein n=1 Tax=Pleurotus eryngii TaxID=5323 RepID=A0A9P5ZI01_PLEER|nr:hypothetical protein BDN71DRAFT_465055 [Pleurotus eryngii]
MVGSGGFDEVLAKALPIETARVSCTPITTQRMPSVVLRVTDAEHIHSTVQRSTSYTRARDGRLSASTPTTPSTRVPSSIGTQNPIFKRLLRPVCGIRIFKSRRAIPALLHTVSAIASFLTCPAPPRLSLNLPLCSIKPGRMFSDSFSNQPSCALSVNLKASPDLTPVHGMSTHIVRANFRCCHDGNYVSTTQESAV